MEPLLFLSHRLPYPPNKGDKIRSWHLLRHLAERYRVYLGTFVDDEQDWQHVAAVEKICAEVFVRPLPGLRARVRSLRGLLSGEPLTLPYYRDAAMARWVRECQREQDIRHLFAFSSAMGQYAPEPREWPMRRVMDLVDVDSDKWHQYSERKAWPMSWVYAREARTLGTYERRLAAEWDACLLVSEVEAQWLRERAPESAARIHALNNGVDVAHFYPDQVFNRPYAEGERALVFTGAMDYWANVDAVCWFAAEVWPEILRQQPAARFYIVGSRPTAAVQALAQRPGIQVTGTVPDVRPYVAHAHVAVAPLRVARGIQNKVLEAMALGRPLVMTSAAADGIPLDGLSGVMVCDAASEQVRACSDLLQQEAAPAPDRGMRAWVCQHYDWNRNLARLDQYLAAPSVVNPQAVLAAGLGL
ncbi:MAG TPA: TIGR03087 family PEP-CTERM/XrtA system glycosyltransferase [Gammaproteobacteria bacterium]